MTKAIEYHAGAWPGRWLTMAMYVLVEAQMILMALMLLVIIVAYLLMLGLVNFAEGVIDEGQQTVREAPLSGANASARSI
jgi:hypothetical protein